MSRTYDQGYAQALADLGAAFAELADEAQREMNGAIQQSQDAGEFQYRSGEEGASKALADALHLKIGWMKAMQICMAAERRHLRTQHAA